jgi:threonine/homoserine/homoserine lactone efflux protein
VPDGEPDSLILLNGFVTGLLLQIAIGPVFFLILNTTIQKTMVDGFLAVLAVTFVDYFYICLATVGVGKMLERPRIKLTLQTVGSIVLTAFGVMMIVSSAKPTITAAGNEVGHSNLLSSFLSAFLLTLSSPLTIVFWTSLFATKATEKGYGKRQLIPFGVGAGASTAIFLGLSVIVFSIVKASIPSLAIRILNGAVGIVFLGYGILRFGKSLRRDA